MYHVFSFHNVIFQDRVDEHKLMQRESLLESVESPLSDRPDNVLRSHENASSHHAVRTFGGLVAAGALRTLVMRPTTAGYLVFQAYSLVSGTGCYQGHKKRKRATVITVWAEQPRTVRGRRRKFSKSGGFRCSELEKWGSG